MKNAFIAIILVATATLCAVIIVQRNRFVAQAAQLARTEARLAEVEAQSNERTDAIQRLELTERKADMLQQALNTTSATAEEKTKQVEQLQQSLATAKTNEGVNPLAGIMKDPKTKEMFTALQKKALGPVIERSYSPLFKQLGLTPEQSTILKDLLQKKVLARSEVEMSTLNGNLDAEKRADMAKQIKIQTDECYAQIKQFLGDDNYEAFQTYEKSVPDRQVVGHFRDQLASSSTPLTPAQETQLIQAVADLRTSFTWTTDYDNEKPSASDPATMFTEEKVTKYEQEKALYDQQLLTRAGQFLAPEQVTSLAQFQEAQRNVQITGMKFAAKMFGQKGQ